MLLSFPLKFYIWKQSVQACLHKPSTNVRIISDLWVGMIGQQESILYASINNVSIRVNYY